MDYSCIFYASQSYLDVRKKISRPVAHAFEMNDLSLSCVYDVNFNKFKKHLDVFFERSMEKLGRLVSVKIEKIAINKKNVDFNSIDFAGIYNLLI